MVIFSEKIGDNNRKCNISAILFVTTQLLPFVFHCSALQCN